MNELLGVMDNSLIQGLSYGIAAIGVSLAFRVLRFPDLTADGSFALGAVVAGASLSAGSHWSLALAAAAVFGALAGLTTGVVSTALRVNRLLAGILTSMAAYSIVFRVLGNRSNVGLLDAETPFSSAAGIDRMERFAALLIHPGTACLLLAIALLVSAALVVLLRSDFGLLLRGVGGNAELMESLGRRTWFLTLLGLALANTLAGIAGALVATQQGFADANMGAGLVVTLIAGLVLGEEALGYFGVDQRGIVAVVAAPILGMSLYFFLYLAVLRASLLGWLPFTIQPTDLKLVSAIVLAAGSVLRATGKSPVRAEVLPV